MALTFEQAYEQEQFYRAKDPAVLARMANVGIAAFAGPIAAGKNYQMSLSELPTAGNITTRAPRPGDTNYRYITLNDMLERIDNADLVQYGVLKETRAIYATDIDDYQEGAVHAKDVLVDSIDQLTRQGFGTVRHIGVLAFPDDWEKRLDKRFMELETGQIRGRLDEGEHSLRIITGEWAARQDRLLIVSSSLHTVHNAELIKEFIETGVTPGVNDEAAKVGRAMLAVLPELRAKYLGE